MTRRCLLVFGVLAAATRVASAQPVEPVPVPPVPVPPGLSAADLRARPLLSRAERVAMRERCDRKEPDCDRIALFGNLERAALVKALGQRDLAVDPHPDGKVVGRIHVVTMPVFGDDEKMFRWANIFHVSSKEYVIEREVILRPGEPFEFDKVDETQRKLRDPLFTSLAVVVPVLPADGAPPGTVDLLVVTRDIFSLRMNSNYEFQDQRFTYLALSLSENNFFGRRMTLALSFVMDQAAFFLGPLFIDKNFLGKQLEVRGRGGPLINRGSLDVEGSESSFVVSRPLWSLDSAWSWSVDWSHHFAIERAFRGTSLRTYDAPSTPDNDMLPYTYRDRTWSLGLSGVHQRGGDDVKHLFKAGYDLTSQHPSVLDDFMGSPEARADFERFVLPRYERTGVIYTAYEIYTPKYREYRDIDAFDLAEDTRLGPRFQVLVGAGLKLLASDHNFGRLSLEAGWTAGFRQDGLASAAATFSTRLEDGAFVDRLAATSLRLVTPGSRAGRLVAELRLTAVYRDASNRYYTLGGDNGLRGYPINFFAGDRRAVLQAEWRSRSVRLFLGSRWGLLAFYDAGGADERAADVAIYQDVGIGIRSLGPQLSPEVFRFDLAIPLTEYSVETASGTVRHGAWPPRFIAGYRQAF